MKPNERAQKNHNELFPGHSSTLAVTDPELIETFDNFAFDEVLAYGALDPMRSSPSGASHCPCRVSPRLHPIPVPRRAWRSKSASSAMRGECEMAQRTWFVTGV